MDWTQFSEYAAIAATIVAVTGVVGAAAMQFLKQVLDVFRVDVPGRVSAVASSIISGGLAAYVMHQQGIPLLMAIPAVLVALYAPKASYDAVRRLDAKREKPPENKYYNPN